MMVTELTEQGLLKDEIISLSHFYGMWAAVHIGAVCLGMRLLL